MFACTKNRLFLAEHHVEPSFFSKILKSIISKACVGNFFGKHLKREISFDSWWDSFKIKAGEYSSLKKKLRSEKFQFHFKFLNVFWQKSSKQKNAHEKTFVVHL